jgi:hypothetical protein
MTHDLARSIGAAQGFGPRSTAANDYKLVVVHDRGTDSSRLTASFTMTPLERGPQ